MGAWKGIYMGLQDAQADRERQRAADLEEKKLKMMEDQARTDRLFRLAELTKGRASDAEALGTAYDNTTVPTASDRVSSGSVPDTTEAIPAPSTLTARDTLVVTPPSPEEVPTRVTPGLVDNTYTRSLQSDFGVTDESIAKIAPYGIKVVKQVNDMIVEMNKQSLESGVPFDANKVISDIRVHIVQGKPVSYDALASKFDLGTLSTEDKSLLDYSARTAPMVDIQYIGASPKASEPPKIDEIKTIEGMANDSIAQLVESRFRAVSDRIAQGDLSRETAAEHTKLQQDRDWLSKNGPTADMINTYGMGTILGQIKTRPSLLRGSFSQVYQEALDAVTFSDPADAQDAVQAESIQPGQPIIVGTQVVKAPQRLEDTVGIPSFDSEEAMRAAIESGTFQLGEHGSVIIAGQRYDY